MRRFLALAAVLVMTTSAACAQLSRSTDSGNASSEPATNERGNIVKQAGEPAGITNKLKAGKEELTFTLNSLSMTDVCEKNYGSFTDSTKPEHGHFLVLDMSVTTAADLDPMIGGLVLNPNSFSTIGPDGVTETDLATMGTYSCFSDERFPTEGFKSSQKYAGKIVLDTKNKSGVLIYTLGGFEGGWEWAYTV
ncbi:hypothetical protein [Alloactinosynnema sp. L-07]|uniref:hypothetical protein n=1 Tax=Alloactinosynnema sp. L-07 TaxID=1653480 RepID=UPI0012F7661D|nr:hypothetical protein [Alloactinosynnema sp. L-07]